MRILDVTITAAADGSSLGNPGPAGWAWYVDDDCWAAGGWEKSTNNRGELMAVLDLLRQTAGEAAPLRVLCDSQYVINVVTKWSKGWKKKGWKKSDGKPVLNVDLVKELDAELAGRDVTFEWVRGHAGHALNEAADLRARAAATAFKEGRTPDTGPGFVTGDGDSAPEPVEPAPEETDQDDLFSFEPEHAPADEDLSPDGTDTDQVIALERWLHSPAPDNDLPQWAALLHAGWFQVRPEGSVVRRDDVMSGVLSPLRREVTVLEARQVRPDEILLLWRGTSPVGDHMAAADTAQTPDTLHTSLWTHDGAAWLQRCEHVTPEQS